LNLERGSVGEAITDRYWQIRYKGYRWVSLSLIHRETLSTLHIFTRFVEASKCCQIAYNEKLTRSGNCVSFSGLDHKALNVPCDWNPAIQYNYLKNISTSSAYISRYNCVSLYGIFCLNVHQLESLMKATKYIKAKISKKIWHTVKLP
jgi:hypothetical protein